MEISLNLLRQAIVNYNWNRYLVDGFPRNWDNLEGWNKGMSDLCELESVLFIDCDEQQLEQRILSRGLSSGRDDDNLLSAKKRFATFRRETMPIVEHFRQVSPEKVTQISGDGEVDAVYAELRKPVVRHIEEELSELAVKLGDEALSVDSRMQKWLPDAEHQSVTLSGTRATTKCRFQVEVRPLLSHPSKIYLNACVSFS